MKKVKKIVNIISIIIFIYLILFIISSFFLRRNGLDYLSYVYLFNFILLVCLVLGYSSFLIISDIGKSKIYTYILLLFIALSEGFILFLIFFTSKLFLNIGVDSVIIKDNQYYVQSQKFVCGSLHQLECVEYEEYINKFVKKIK